MVKMNEYREEVSVTARLGAETAKWVKGSGNKSLLFSQAMEFYHDYCVYRKGFLIRIIESNYELCKQLLRKIGRIIKKKELGVL